MGQAIALRTDYTAGEVRRLAKRAKDVGQTRRLLAIAAVLDGASRAEAAKVGGMDRQTLRDWAHRYNEGGLGGLFNLPRRNGPRPRLSAEQRAEVAKWVEEGPDFARDGVVRWRCVDLQARIERAFDVSLHERTVGRLLRTLSFRRMSVRPQHPKSQPEAQAIFSVSLAAS